MGISIDRFSRPFINKLSQPLPDNKPVQKVREERKFDEVLITASSRQTDEKKVMEGLVQDVMSSVYHEVPDDRIEALKDEIANGGYRVDADAVARRMLLAEGEEGNE